MTQLTEKLKAWAIQKEWIMKLPGAWRLKYEHYHDQFIEPDPEKDTEKRLPDVKYEAQEDGDIVWNPYSGEHFRCPYCGQAHEFRFTYDAKDLRLKQDHNLTKIWLEVHEYRVPSKKYESDTQAYRDYVSKLWNKIDIPCHLCGETAPKWRWVHAYQNPLLYFETENICHCGGEMYFEPDALGNHYLTCEDCNWVKPGSAISGAERTD